MLCAPLFEGEDRWQWDLPVARVGETFGRDLAGADQADDVLAGKAEPGGGLSRGEELFLTGDVDRDLQPPKLATEFLERLELEGRSL